MACRSWSCSYASRRCTKAGRSRLRCCSSSHSASIGAIIVRDAPRPDERRLSADRPPDDDGLGLQERDPDDRIRGAGGAQGRTRVIDAALEAAKPAPAPDPDDQLRLHLRRPAAGALDRCGRQQSHRDRHRGDRGHADRDGPRGILHSRSSSSWSAAACPRRHRQAARPPHRVTRIKNGEGSRFLPRRCRRPIPSWSQHDDPA